MMTVEELLAISDESERVNALYELLNEDSRLNYSKAARVEFIMTVKYIEKYLKPDSRILDVGAGAGEYSIYFADRGYVVDAIELAEKNLRDFQKKIKPEHSITLARGNALDLSSIPNASYDIVLLMGPLYHLRSAEDKRRAIEEAKRVIKPDGVIAFAFITHDMIFLTELSSNEHYFSTGDYDHDSMRLHDFPFVFTTIPESAELLKSCGIELLHTVAVDGPSELLAEKINKMNDFEYGQYLKYMDMICEKPELLGMSNHILYIGRQA